MLFCSCETFHCRTFCKELVGADNRFARRLPQFWQLPQAVDSCGHAASLASKNPGRRGGSARGLGKQNLTPDGWGEGGRDPRKRAGPWPGSGGPGRKTGGSLPPSPPSWCRSDQRRQTNAASPETRSGMGLATTGRSARRAGWIDIQVEGWFRDDCLGRCLSRSPRRTTWWRAGRRSRNPIARSAERGQWRA